MMLYQYLYSHIAPQSHCGIFPPVAVFRGKRQDIEGNVIREVEELVEEGCGAYDIAFGGEQFQGGGVQTRQGGEGNTDNKQKFSSDDGVEVMLPYKWMKALSDGKMIR